MRRFSYSLIGGFCLCLMMGLPGSCLAHDKRDSSSYELGYRNAWQQGYDNGFRDGAEHGRSDRSRGLDYDLNNRDFKNGNRGYEKFMGKKGDYKKGYREGYQAGYQSNYGSRSRGRWGESSRHREDRYGQLPHYQGGSDRGRGYRGIAFDKGYRDGLDDGRKDLRKNDRFDPTRHGDYRDADNGYKKDYGSKDQYRQEYRSGYMQGYRDGYGRQQGHRR